MAVSKTHLDEVIDYPQKVIRALYDNQNFVSLLLNIPNANLTDLNIEDAYYEHMFDYQYVDETVTEAESFCWVDTEIFYKSLTTKTILIDILVGVHKDIMKPSDDFKTFGNRRDNLIREIDYTLRGMDIGGIGPLEPIGRIRPVAIGNKFSGKQICFSGPDFAIARNIKR